MTRDLVIIGSGPAGLSASIYAKRANLDVLVIEKEFLGTGQIAESSRVDNYIGLVGISGYALGEAFRSDAEKIGVEFCQAEAVKITQKNGLWITELDNCKAVGAKAVIYAAGASHKKLNISGEDKFIGNGVSFCALCDGALYKNKAAAVVGGGDTALDDAIYLSDIAETVYLIHRRNEFRGAEKSVLTVKAKANIETVMGANVVEITGGKNVEAVILDNGRKIYVNGVFIAIGMAPQTELLKNIAAIDSSGYIQADENGVTTADGIFAAGDVRTKKLRQAITAAADGANAAISALEYIRLF